MATTQQSAAGCLCDNKKEPVETKTSWKTYLPVMLSFCLLAAGIAFDKFIHPPFFQETVRMIWYAVAYLPVGLPVIIECFKALRQGEFFTEFTLMCIATVGAFVIGQYQESVAVMLFYSVGELFQDSAVNKAKRNIKSLLDIRPAAATVLRNNRYETVTPETVKIGETIQVKAGEKVPLDGNMLSAASSFNTSALTGESRPKTIRRGEAVLAGMLNLDKVIDVKVSKNFEDSSLSKILDLVQNAVTRKAKAELLIRRFAKIYTPLVFSLAVLLVIVPYFVSSHYVFDEWFSRALVFLVISCPCALVISIPLGYFGGIGVASKHGILFKGSNFMDIITKVNTVVMDKTGTLTQGVFKVQDVVVADKYDKTEFLRTISAIEKNSTHPIAKAIAAYCAADAATYDASGVEEIAGMGLAGIVNGKKILAGNSKLLKKYSVDYDAAIDTIVESIVAMAVDNTYAGYIVISDELKPDARQAIAGLHEIGVPDVRLLSGDKEAITQKVAHEIGIDHAVGNLLPEEKLREVEYLKQDKNKVVAFVGDGVNDAPVLAVSDIGIAMGAMGSDVAIETADVVIQTDHPSKVVTAIKIGKATKNIVIQNIVLAMGIKALVLVLGAFGVATMWEAVFADVGVALLAILNAVRILRKKF